MEKAFLILENLEYDSKNSSLKSNENLNNQTQNELWYVSNVDIFDVVVAWSLSFCETIVDSVVGGDDFDLLQIVYNAIQIKSFAQRLWDNKFEKKIRKIVRNTTFNSTKSEVALQIIQCALCYNICDISIISDLCRALNSQLVSIRFTVVKLVADALSLRDENAINFVESNIVTQITALLQDENFQIDDTTFRMYINLLFDAMRKRNLLKIGDNIQINVDYTNNTDEFLILMASVHFCAKSVPLFFSIRNYPRRKNQFDQKKIEPSFIKALRHALSKKYSYIANSL